MNKYEVLEIIGEGTYGIVVKAREKVIFIPFPLGLYIYIFTNHYLF